MPISTPVPSRRSKPDISGLPHPRQPLVRPVSDREVCRLVRQMVAELILLFGDRILCRRDRRRMACQCAADFDVYLPRRPEHAAA